MKWKRVLLAFSAAGFLSLPAWADNWTKNIVPNQLLISNLENAEKFNESAEACLKFAEIDKKNSKHWTEEAGVQKRLQQLVARYRSEEFRNFSRSLRMQAAMELYAKSITLIQKHHLEGRKLEDLFKAGWDDLNISLRSRSFREWAGLPENLSVKEIKETIQKYTKSVTSLDSMQSQVKSLAAELQQEYGIAPASTILIFQHAAIESLDNYSKMMTPALTEFYSSVQRGDLAGTGLVLKKDQDKYIVDSIWPDSPASKLGISRGDVVQAVNGRDIDNLTADEVCSMLWGSVGTELSVMYQKQDHLAKKEAVMIRESGFETATIPVSKIADTQFGVGYIQIAQMNQRTVQELDLQLHRLSQQGMRSLVLDLRGNSGGDIQIAKSIAERFLEGGLFATTKGRKANAEAQFVIQSAGFHYSIPLVILVNEKTASSAEMLAMALKSHPRAVTVGKMTAKKGTVQSLFPLDRNFGTIKLTTANWNGVQDMPGTNGVIPDIIIDSEPIQNGDQAERSQQIQTNTAIELARKLAHSP